MKPFQQVNIALPTPLPDRAKKPEAGKPEAGNDEPYLNAKYMNLPLYQIDAFAEEPFKGNPAAVCPLEYWLPEKTLQAIAEENNLSETSFYVERDGVYELRWFTPTREVDLCGHATLAAAHVIFQTIQAKQELCYAAQ